MMINPNGKLDRSTKKTGVRIPFVAVSGFVLKEAGDLITISPADEEKVFIDQLRWSDAAVPEALLDFHQVARTTSHLSHSLPFNKLPFTRHDKITFAGAFVVGRDLEAKSMVDC